MKRTCTMPAAERGLRAWFRGSAAGKRSAYTLVTV